MKNLTCSPGFLVFPVGREEELFLGHKPTFSPWLRGQLGSVPTQLEWHGVTKTRDLWRHRLVWVKPIPFHGQGHCLGERFHQFGLLFILFPHFPLPPLMSKPTACAATLPVLVPQSSVSSCSVKCQKTSRNGARTNSTQEQEELPVEHKPWISLTNRSCLCHKGCRPGLAKQQPQWYQEVAAGFVNLDGFASYELIPLSSTVIINFVLGFPPPLVIQLLWSSLLSLPNHSFGINATNFYHLVLGWKPLPATVHMHLPW